MIDQLKEEVLRKFGESLISTKDCQHLSDQIYLETEQRISTTTIRRLYGFLKSNTMSAKFTLNALAKYVGFYSLEDFYDYAATQTHKELNFEGNWRELYEKALSFSKETFKLVSGQSGIPFQSVVSRDQSEERISRFLDSSKTALSFVGPGGFGKSTMLAKWFEKNWLQKENKDVVLFLNASFMISFLNKGFRLDRWVQAQLGFMEKDILVNFLENPEACESRIIFVVDALDEITYDNKMLERLFLQLNQFILNYQDSKNVKLIITSRNSTWEKFALPFILKGNSILDCWFELDIKLNQQNQKNLDPLSFREIQYVLDHTLNQQFSTNILVSDFSYSQKETISNPFFLELFIKLYDPEKHDGVSNGYLLMHEFIQNKIFYSRYSDEKVDILNCLLRLIENGKKGTSAKKVDLREQFPIHLRSVGNYFNAYEELVSYGLLTEFITINEHNSYCKFVKVTNERLFEALIGIGIIQKNKGVDFDLIKKVEREYSGFDIKNRLVGFLCTSAISSGRQLELRDFFKLSDDTLSDPEIVEIILNSSLFFENDQLLSHFASQKKAEHHMFKQFSNINGVNKGERKILEIFAEKGRTKNVKIKSLGLLLINAIFILETDNAEKYYQTLLLEEPDTSCTGFAISIRLAAILLYNYFTGNGNNTVEFLKLFYYREMAYKQYAEANDNFVVEFELVLCMALVYTKSFHKVVQLIDDAEYLYNQFDLREHSRNYKMLQCYKLIAQNALGLEITNSQEKFLIACEKDIFSYGNYFIQTYYHSFLSSYYFSKGDREKTENHLNIAIEISENANLKLCTAGLLSKMAQRYSEWGEKKKEEICLGEKHQIVGCHLFVNNTEAIFV